MELIKTATLFSSSTNLLFLHNSTPPKPDRIAGTKLELRVRFVCVNVKIYTQLCVNSIKKTLGNHPLRSYE